jgi:hypothetical protein
MLSPALSPFLFLFLFNHILFDLFVFNLLPVQKVEPKRRRSNAAAALTGRELRPDVLACFQIYYRANFEFKYGVFKNLQCPKTPQDPRRSSLLGPYKAGNY